MTRFSSVVLAIAMAAVGGCQTAAPQSPSYLFVWAGDGDRKASDFLGVIDATPGAPAYGRIVASLPTGDLGHPHHTEHEMPATGHLLANAFHGGRTYLFDLSQPLQPRLATSFAALAGFAHPHSFIRLANGNVMATFQYAADSATHGASHDASPQKVEHTTGGIVEMDERGQVIRGVSARDPAISDSYLYPYSVLPMPSIDRAVSTTTDMDPDNLKATSQWVQFWRLSDLSLLRTIALAPGPRGDENQLTGEPRLLEDGKSVYIHTFKCGLYLIRDVDSAEPRAQFVYAFEGKDCGVPVRAGRYWLQPVPATHSIDVLDIANPEQPRKVSSAALGEDEEPHWVAIDAAGRRVVVNSAGYTKSNRLYVLEFDPASGALTVDARFRDVDDPRPGINLTGKRWPHGFEGKASPHGTVFSR